MANRHPRELEEELAEQLDSVKAQAAVLAQAMQTSEPPCCAHPS